MLYRFIIVLFEYLTRYFVNKLDGRRYEKYFPRQGVKNQHLSVVNHNLRCQISTFAFVVNESGKFIEDELESLKDSRALRR